MNAGMKHDLFAPQRFSCVAQSTATSALLLLLASVLQTLAACDPVAESVQRTGRAVIVHEAPMTCGLGGEIASRIMEECFLHLEAPVQRVAGFDCIMPYYKLELDYQPDAARIEQAIAEVSSY